MPGNRDQSYDLEHAAIVTPADALPAALRKAAEWLRDAAHERAGLDWPIAAGAPAGRPAIKLRCAADLPLEGFTVRLDLVSGTAVVSLTAGSPRAVLFAVGWLLRRLEWREGSATLRHLAPDTLIEEAPRFALRGHQLGYRSLPNTYDAWDVGQFERYIRELLIFGINSIELVPTVDPNEPATALMPETPWETNRQLSALLAEYDLDVWAWLPIEDGDPAKPEERAGMLAHRKALFESMVRLDHLFVPGGDPGSVPAQCLMPFLADLSAVLRTRHPDAGMWVSTQGFSGSDMAWFYQYLEAHRPEWLTGVVFGPWVRDTLSGMRRSVPERYSVRRYPDIGHCCRCQYPVPQWDHAFALTLGREPIDPRPAAMAHVHNLLMAHADGAVTYSEGVNDDVNKAVWAARLWNPVRPVRDILVDYGRAYFGDAQAERVADGLLALEENWRGPLATNPGPARALALWREIDRACAGAGGWRARQGLFRAVYDRYVQERLALETEHEQAALTLLAAGTAGAAAQARKVLGATPSNPSTAALRAELLAIGESLWKSIGMQMSVPLYGADGPERGAVLDYLDAPLNDRAWILRELDSMDDFHIEAVAGTIVHWTDPGSLGFYDSLGDALREPHLVREPWEGDPGYLGSPQDEFSREQPGWRLSWLTQAGTLYGTSLRMRYADLDPAATYLLRAVYTGRFRPTMTLTANGVSVHGPTQGPDPPARLAFPIPCEATRTGALELIWECVAGRGCQVAEVWLIRTEARSLT